MVLVDGEESDDAEINGNTVIVPFLAGTEQIEIIGTFVNYLNNCDIRKIKT